MTYECLEAWSDLIKYLGALFQIGSQLHVHVVCSGKLHQDSFAIVATVALLLLAKLSVGGLWMKKELLYYQVTKTPPAESKIMYVVALNSMSPTIQPAATHMNVSLFETS